VTLIAGMLSYIQTGSVAGGPDFYDGSAWTSIRYPNLNVISDATSVTLRRQGAGTGVQLMNDGSVNMAKAFIGTGSIGSTLDQTGLVMKIGADTAKLATDANGFTMDSPLNITGGLQTSAAITAPTFNGNVSAATVAATGAVTAASVAATGAVTGATVQGGKVLLGTAAPYGTIKHADGGTAELDVGSDSTVQIRGTSLTVNPPTTFAGTTQHNGLATFAAPPVVTQSGKDASIQIAMIQMVSGNVAPTGNPPDGTVYFTY